MFSVTETEAAAIRRVFEEEGELSAMIELRRHFPGHHRQRQGTGMRPDYRGVEAGACSVPSGGAVAARQAAIGRIAGFAANACRYAECGGVE